MESDIDLEFSKVWLLPTTSLHEMKRVGDVFIRKEDMKYPMMWKPLAANETQQAESRRRLICLADHIIPGHGPLFRVTNSMKRRLNCPFRYTWWLIQVSEEEWFAQKRDLNFRKITDRVHLGMNSQATRQLSTFLRAEKNHFPKIRTIKHQNILSTESFPQVTLPCLKLRFSDANCHHRKPNSPFNTIEGWGGLVGQAFSRY